MKRFCLPQCRIEVYQIIKYTITRLPLPIHVSVEGEFYLWFNFILLSFSVRYQMQDNDLQGQKNNITQGVKMKAKVKL